MTPSTASFDSFERESIDWSASTSSSSGGMLASERERCPIGVREPPATKIVLDRAFMLSPGE